MGAVDSMPSRSLVSVFTRQSREPRVSNYKYVFSFIYQSFYASDDDVLPNNATPMYSDSEGRTLKIALRRTNYQHICIGVVSSTAR